jgi:hypothetical protein
MSLKVSFEMPRRMCLGPVLIDQSTSLGASHDYHSGIPLRRQALAMDVAGNVVNRFTRRASAGFTACL